MIGNVYVKYEEEEMAEKVPSSPLLLPPSLPPSSLLLALTVRRETVCVCMCVCGDGVVTALNALNGRFYAGRLIMAEYSPVTDFRESRCRQYEETSC
eukprot:896588-Rhodomonas_salina.4